MGKLKELRRQTLLEKAAAEKAQAGLREEALLQAIGKLRSAVIIFTQGENWVQRHLSANGCWPWRTVVRDEIVWAGEGNPQELADKAMISVFGKDYKTQEKEKKKE